MADTALMVQREVSVFIADGDSDLDGVGYWALDAEGGLELGGTGISARSLISPDATEATSRRETSGLLISLLAAKAIGRVHLGVDVRPPSSAGFGVGDYRHPQER